MKSKERITKENISFLNPTLILKGEKGMIWGLIRINCNSKGDKKKMLRPSHREAIKQD